jgi:DNA polymerase-4
MDSRTVNWLFVDLNSYFASIEQELRPELRGQPIGIVPVADVQTTVCIAASYQAKKYGVKTGTAVHDAKVLCLHIILVEARPRHYVEFHHRIVGAIERCIPVQAVMSCDEFACQLLGRERDLPRAVAIAYAIKQELRTIGITLRCSIGLAPNRLLAKIAGDMDKPDGLMIFERRNLPQALYCLKLEDIPGIGSRMEERVRAAGISTMRELCALPRDRMHTIWGSVWGDRLWHWFRGEDFLEPEPRTLQTLSRQHILPPRCRPRDVARGVALKLLHSTARRMRRERLWAGGVAVQISYYSGKPYDAGIRIARCSDTLTLQEHFLILWNRSPIQDDLASLTVMLTHLDTEPTSNLFDLDSRPETGQAKQRVISAVDAMNARYGLNTVFLGSIHDARKEAPTRIPFGPPPPLEEFDDTADNVRRPPTRYTLSAEQLARRKDKQA